MALRAGADIVLGLPVSFSVCEAERFALGGVSILARTGLVHSLSFGVEPGNEDCILPAAQLLETPDSAFQAALRKGLDQGLPFPRAQGEALAVRLGLPPDCLAAPNTVLAICYARANLRLNAGLALHPIPRRGAYHADTLPDESETALPSATAVRAAILQHAWPSVRRAMPEAAYVILQGEIAQNRLHRPDALDALLRWTLRSGHDFLHLPGLSEGLENRLPLGADALTREGMVQSIRSKRYPYARVNRLLTHALLDTHAQALSPLPQYACLLGFKRERSSLLRSAKNLPLLPRLKPQDRLPEQLLDARAWDLWALGAGQPFGALYRCQPVIL